MSKLNLQIIGHIGNDAEINSLPNGNKVVNFSVAHSESFLNKGGVKETITTWVRCADFREQSTKIAPYIKKGGLIEVSGQPSVSAYIDKNTNESIGRLELRVKSITLLSSAD